MNYIRRKLGLQMQTLAGDMMLHHVPDKKKSLYDAILRNDVTKNLPLLTQRPQGREENLSG